MNMNLGLLILRLGIAGMMLGAHGIPKILNFSTLKDTFSDPIGLGSSASLVLAIFAEVVCTLAVMVGFKVRFTVIPPLVTMLVAAFIIHADDPWGKKEFALLYAIPYIALLISGAGKYSVGKD